MNDLTAKVNKLIELILFVAPIPVLAFILQNYGFLGRYTYYESVVFLAIVLFALRIYLGAWHWLSFYLFRKDEVVGYFLHKLEAVDMFVFKSALDLKLWELESSLQLLLGVTETNEQEVCARLLLNMLNGSERFGGVQTGLMLRIALREALKRYALAHPERICKFPSNRRSTPRRRSGDRMETENRRAGGHPA